MRTKPLYRSLAISLGLSLISVLDTWANPAEVSSSSTVIAQPLIVPADTLTEEESRAIRDYTLLDYRYMNAALRKTNKLRLAPWQKEKMAAVLRGLRKLPDYQGEVYRCGTLPQDVFNQHIPGTIVIYQGFTSTGREPKPWIGCQHSFVIKSLHGKSIEQFAGDPSEREVLFSAWTSFRVIRIETSIIRIATLIS